MTKWSVIVRIVEEGEQGILEIPVAKKQVGIFLAEALNAARVLNRPFNGATIVKASVAPGLVRR